MNSLIKKHEGYTPYPDEELTAPLMLLFPFDGTDCGHDLAIDMARDYGNPSELYTNLNGDSDEELIEAIRKKGLVVCTVRFSGEPLCPSIRYIKQESERKHYVQ